MGNRQESNEAMGNEAMRKKDNGIIDDNMINLPYKYFIHSLEIH